MPCAIRGEQSCFANILPVPALPEVLREAKIQPAYRLTQELHSIFCPRLSVTLLKFFTPKH